MKLTDEQHAAVNTCAQDCLVVAGAGTGKTAVLTGRVRHLLHAGASPEQFLVLTFTRKAAAEMRDRLLALLRDDETPQPERMVDGMLFGTFHHFALHVLQSHGHELGYLQREITLVDVADADMLLQSCCQDLGIVHDNKWTGGHTWTRVREIRDGYYQTGDWPDDGDRAVRAVKHYHASLFSMNAVDYGLLQTRCLECFGARAVFDYWTDRIKHVLVDEAQDCNLVQHRLVGVFCPVWSSDTWKSSLFAVGDPRQSIYGWRGATPELMYDDAKHEYTLTQSFRSGKAIVDTANALIAHNPEAGAPMQASDKRDVVLHVAGRTADIVQALQVLHDPSNHGIDERFDMGDGFAWSDIAVLSRKHFALRVLGDRLADANIPYHRVGSGFDVCDMDKFRDLHAVLRLAVNERDDLAAMRIVDCLGLRSNLAQYRVEASEAGKSLGGHVIKSVRTRADLHGGHSDGLSDLFAKLRTDAASVSVVDAAALIVESRLFGNPDLFASSRAFWTYHCLEMFTVADALAWFATRDALDDDPVGPVVTLSTIHAAKGREWPCVVLLDLNEGGLPGFRALNIPEAINEERRVCYVAVTRAQKCVVLHHRRNQDQVRQRRKQPPSRFLSDMGCPVLEDLNV